MRPLIQCLGEVHERHWKVGIFLFFTMQSYEGFKEEDIPLHYALYNLE
jgi:hypothetical protein